MESQATSFDWASIIGPIISAIGSIASGGWGGLVALAGTAVGLIMGATFLIRSLNKKIDKRDMDNSGTHVGRDAADIHAQAKKNQDLLDCLEKDSPPK